jgi:apolipoprotein D and lipocalin family protein
MKTLLLPTLITGLSGSWRILVMVALLGLAACSTAPPQGITAVTPFDIKRYEGQWFEVARMDHSFERGLSDVSARYRIQADGSVQVINRGFDVQKNAWKEAVGRALFTGDPTTASLKVSFFGPFYGGYHVVALDQQAYQWSMVVGPDRDYVWILARDKQLSPAVREPLLAQAKALGIAVDKLIWVAQTRQDK